MPIVVPDVLPAVKVKVVPFTTRVSPVVMPVARSFEVELAVPESSVEPLIPAVEPEARASGTAWTSLLRRRA